MPTMAATEPTVAEALAAADKQLMNRAFVVGRDLNRKFTLDDLTSLQSGLPVQDLYRAAEAFVRLYSEQRRDPNFRPFGYMDDMATALTMFGALTPAQAKGVLNCLMAEARQRMNRRPDIQALTPGTPATEPTIQAEPLPDGFYTAELGNGQWRTFRLKSLTVEQRQRFGNPAGSQYASLLIGPANTSDYARYAIVSGDRVIRRFPNVRSFAGREASQEHLSLADEALALILRSPDRRAEFGLAYALRSTRCYVCGLVLTTPESIRTGIGPVCAGR